MNSIFFSRKKERKRTFELAAVRLFDVVVVALRSILVVELLFGRPDSNIS